MIIYFNATPHTELDLLLLKGKSMSMLPDIETELRTIPAKNGAHKGHTRMKERYFRIPFALQGLNEQEVHQKVEDLKRIFVTSLGQPREVQLKFSWQDDRYYKVTLHNATPYFLETDYAEVELEFVAPDPYAYGVVPIEFTHTVNVGSSLGHGFFTDAAFTPKMRFECTDLSAGRDFIMKLTSSETTGEPPTAASEIYLKNTTRFVIGDVIEIDYERHSVTLNGLDAMHLLDWHQTKFSDHSRGFNNIQFQLHWKGTISYTPKYI